MRDNLNILHELKEAGATNIINAGNANHYFLPEDYFNKLAENVVAHVFIISIPFKNPYTIPAGYFENLPGIVLEKINFFSTVSAQAQLSKNTYAVPDGYFENFAENILSKIKNTLTSSVQEELEEISPLLSKIPRTNVYTVPQNYFTALDANKSISAESPAKVISLGGKSRKWINYVAAACIAAVLFGSGYFYFSGLPAKTNIDSTRITNTDVQKEISFLSDKEIADYLKESNSTGVYSNAGINDNQLQNFDIQNLLQNVSDDEIKEYLNQDPQSTKKTEGI